MLNKTPLFVGGVGGALPVLIDLINIDAATMFLGFDPMVFLGYLIRAALLVLLGALLVWVNSETDVKKALQIGIMAPAIVVGFMNGSDLKDTKEELGIAEEALQARQMEGESSAANIDENVLNIKNKGSFWLFPSAYAQDRKLKGIHRDPSAFSRIWYGFTGRSDNGWFVIAGSHTRKKEAKAQANELKKKGYRAKVFPPFQGSSYYGVMIGSWLTLNEAKSLKSVAIQDGLPKDTYLWKYRP